MTAGDHIRIREPDGTVVLLHVLAIEHQHALVRWWVGEWKYAARSCASLRALVKAGTATVSRT